MQASQPEQRLRRSGGHCRGGLRHYCAVARCRPSDGIIADPRAVTHIRGGAGFNEIRGNRCILVLRGVARLARQVPVERQRVAVAEFARAAPAAYLDLVG